MSDRVAGAPLRFESRHHFEWRMNKLQVRFKHRAFPLQSSPWTIPFTSEELLDSRGHGLYPTRPPEGHGDFQRPCRIFTCGVSIASPLPTFFQRTFPIPASTRLCNLRRLLADDLPVFSSFSLTPISNLIFPFSTMLQVLFRSSILHSRIVSQDQTTSPTQYNFEPQVRPSHFLAMDFAALIDIHDERLSKPPLVSHPRKYIDSSSVFGKPRDLNFRASLHAPSISVRWRGILGICSPG